MASGYSTAGTETINNNNITKNFFYSDKGKFSPANIDSTLCTHFVYAYSVLDKDTQQIKPGDEWLDAKKGNFR